MLPQGRNMRSCYADSLYFFFVSLLCYSYLLFYFYEYNGTTFLRGYAAYHTGYSPSLNVSSLLLSLENCNLAINNIKRKKKNKMEKFMLLIKMISFYISFFFRESDDEWSITTATIRFIYNFIKSLRKSLLK